MSLMEIVVHPARARPLKTLGLLLYVGLVAWGLDATLLHAPPAVGAPAIAIILFAGLRGWFLPTRYRFTDRGVEIHRLRTRTLEWERFRGWRRERGGFYLSPFSDPDRFDNFRGLFIPVDPFVVRASPPINGGAVEAVLRQRIDRRSASDKREKSDHSETGG